MMTIECTVDFILFEGPDTDTTQLTTNLQGQILSLMVPLLAIDYSTVIVGGLF